MIETQKITCGNYTLLYKERILLIEEKNVTIDLLLDKTFHLQLDFDFQSDGKETNLTTKADKLESGLKLSFILKNFNNSLGTGLIKPLEILKHKVNGVDHGVYMTFFAYKNGDAPHILDLSIYEEVK